MTAHPGTPAVFPMGPSERFGLVLLLGAVVFALLLVPPVAQAAAPAAPTNLSVTQKNISTATATNFEVIEVSWTKPSGTINSYDISVSDGVGWVPLTTDGAATSIDINPSDFKMPPGHTYKIQIRAVNDDGAGTATSSYPIWLLGADVGLDRVTIKWRGSVPSGSHLQWQRDTDGWNNIPSTTDSTITFTDTGRTPLTTYKYQIRERRGTNVEWSSFVLLVTPGKIAYGANNVVIPDDSDLGTAVAISPDANTLYVGAPGDGAGGTVHIYSWHHASSTWRYNTKIQDNTNGLSLNGDTFFGRSLALSADGGTLAVGDTGDDTGEDNAGAVHLFTGSGVQWTHSTKFNHDTHSALSLSSGDNFGSAVAFSPDATTLFVGAQGTSGGGGPRLHQVRVQRHLVGQRHDQGRFPRPVAGFGG